MVDPNELPIDKRFAALLQAILTAYAARVPPGFKPPANHRSLVWLAWLALASFLGLGHLVTTELRDAAERTARRPGKKNVIPEGQTSFVDIIPPQEDGLPGVYVSLVRLKAGTVRVSCGSYELDLYGCFEPLAALREAYRVGWGFVPAPNGLRFFPPTVCALVLNDPSIVADVAKGTSLPRLHDMDVDNPTHDIKPPGYYGPSDYGPDSFGGTDHGSHLHYEPPYAPGVVSNETTAAETCAPSEKAFRSKAHAQLVKNEEPGERPAKRETVVRTGRMSGKSGIDKPQSKTPKSAKRAKGRKS